MDENPRHDLKAYAFGVFIGFPYFFLRRLYIPGIIHLVLLAIGVTGFILTISTHPLASKWVLFIYILIENLALGFLGIGSGLAGYKSCSWKSPRYFNSSNRVWGFFGRFILLIKLIYTIGFCFILDTGQYAITPNWVVVAGYIVIPLILGLLVWLIRGPIWAVALNTLKESISKLEIITLFGIGVLFVLFFNCVWLIPSLQEAVIDKLPAPDGKAQIQSPPVDEEGQVEFKVKTVPESVKFTDKEISRRKYGLTVQVSGMLFGEFFISLICFAIGIFLIPGEIQRGVVLTVLPKPISRAQYILGKILGGWIIAVICFEALAVVTLLFALPNMGKPLDNTFNILQAMLIVPMKYAILLSLITYFSLWLPELAAGFIGILIFTSGHFSGKILDLASHEFAQTPFLAMGLKATYVLIPHLTAAVSAFILDPNANEFTRIGPVFEWLFWAGIYLLVITSLAVFSFRKRSL